MSGSTCIPDIERCYCTYGAYYPTTWCRIQGSRLTSPFVYPRRKDNPGSSLARPTPPFLHTRDFVGCRVLLRHAEYEATEICRVRRLYMVGYITQLSTINHHLQLYNIIPILFSNLPVLHYILGWSWLLLSLSPPRLSPTPRSESLAVYPPTPIIIIVITRCPIESTGQKHGRTMIRRSVKLGA